MKTIRLPYKKYKNIIFIKRVDYRKYYKKISYLYETYDNNGMMISETLHQSNNPCIITYYNNSLSEIEYYKHGKRHRDYGPAIIHLNKKHEITEEKWYLNDIQLSEKEIDDLKLLIDRRKKMYKVICKMKSRLIKPIS